MHIKTKEKAIQYTLEEIIEAWSKCYGESMQEEYKGFLKELKLKSFFKEKAMKNTAKKVEARLIKINEYLDTDYELEYMRDYDYPYKIVSNERSVDESQRLTVSEAIEWTNGVINAYFALYDRLTVSRRR